MVKTVCLIIIALSLYKLANYSSLGYMSDGVTSLLSEEDRKYSLGASRRVDGIRSDRFVGNGANEAPVFWSEGDRSLYEATVRMMDDNEPATASPTVPTPVGTSAPGVSSVAGFTDAQLLGMTVR